MHSMTPIEFRECGPVVAQLRNLSPAPKYSHEPGPVNNFLFPDIFIGTRTPDLNQNKHYIRDDADPRMTPAKFKGTYRHSHEGPHPWTSQYKGKHLGMFTTELEAAVAYSKAAGFSGEPVPKDSRSLRTVKAKKAPPTSKYVGVRKRCSGPRPWHAHHKNMHLGCFETEIEAANAYSAREGVAGPVLKSQKKKILPCTIVNTTE